MTARGCDAVVKLHLVVVQLKLCPTNVLASCLLYFRILAFNCNFDIIVLGKIDRSRCLSRSGCLRKLLWLFNRLANSLVVHGAGDICASL